VNFLRRYRARTTAHNKVHFAYGKYTCPQLPNETLTIIDSRIGLDSATGSSQDVTSYRHSVTVDKMEKYGIP